VLLAGLEDAEKGLHGFGGEPDDEVLAAELH
jgi:hypothetical protein